MNEEQVKQIAKQVFDERLQATQYGFNSIPFHTHNGTDSPNISQASVNPYFRANGTITMATDGATYTLGLNFKGSRVDFNGVAVHKTLAVIDERALVNGVALLGQSYEFTALSSTAVTVGGPVKNIIQGCSSMTIDAAATPPYAVIASEEHIVYVVQPGTGTSVAVATVTGFSFGKVLIKVALTADWEITGTFTVS